MPLSASKNDVKFPKQVPSQYLLDHFLRMSSDEPPQKGPSNGLFKNAYAEASRIQDENKEEFEALLHSWQGKSLSTCRFANDRCSVA
jgi:hypothetical protein